jgi:hypothetical protein
MRSKIQDARHGDHVQLNPVDSEVRIPHASARNHARATLVRSRNRMPQSLVHLPSRRLSLCHCTPTTTAARLPLPTAVHPVRFYRQRILLALCLAAIGCARGLGSMVITGLRLQLQQPLGLGTDHAHVSTADNRKRSHASRTHGPTSSPRFETTCTHVTRTHSYPQLTTTCVLSDLVFLRTDGRTYARAHPRTHACTHPRTHRVTRRLRTKSA